MKKSYMRIVKKFPQDFLENGKMPTVEEHMTKWLTYYEMIVSVTKQSVKRKKALDNLRWWREQKEWYDEYLKTNQKEV
jgi:hypothetical protein